MHSSSPPYYSPSTPACLRNPLQFKPSNSSPLAESPSASSPVIAAQARRKSQYKPRSPQTPTTTTTTSRRGSGNYSEANRSLSSRSSVSAYSVGGVPENPPKLSMRDRFRARCLERAVKEREKAIKRRRYAGYHRHHLSSDDQPMDDDDDSEDEEDIMKDELFRRIMDNTNRRQLHSYRVSYATEVGSSFDPNLEDAEAWEREFAAPIRAPTRASVSTPMRIHATRIEQEEITPFDLDDAELEEYAEEYARMAAVAEFEDLAEEDIFSWSDIEEFAGATAQLGNEEDGMDVS